MLADKLHVKAGMRIAVSNAPPGLAFGAQGVVVERSLTPGLDLVVLFATTQKDLRARWSKAIHALKFEGALWVAYPKKSSGIQTDLGKGDWDATKDSDWHPVGMVSVDKTWSAVRFKHAPGLDQTRQARQEEAIRDADGAICVDRAARVVTAPRDLKKLLAKNGKARKAFDGLSFTNRKEYVVWILSAKRPETRADRLAKTVERLARGKKNPSER